MTEERQRPKSLEVRRPWNREARVSERSVTINILGDFVRSVVEEHYSKLTNSSLRSEGETQDICKGLQLGGALGGVSRWPETQSWRREKRGIMDQ